MDKSDIKVVSSRVIMLDVGLYIFRYLPALQGESNSIVSLHQSPLARGSLDFFPAEGVTRNTLATSGDCIVLRVKGSWASVLVTDYHFENTPSPVRLKIDRINTTGQPIEESGANTLETVENARPVILRPVVIKLLGHVEARGDVTVIDNWLGTPQGTVRIEGFSINWEDMPKGVDIAYSCRSGIDGDPNIGLSGQFIGTRRQKKPITAVAFALSGPLATDFAISGQVAFAGHPPLAIVPGKELSGPNGTEKLVGLRLIVTARTPQAVSPVSPWNDPAITEIFHSPKKTEL